MPRARLLWGILLLAIGTVSPLWSQGAGPTAAVIEHFFAALNADSIESTAELMTEILSDDFKARRGEEERRALYERLRADLGVLTIEQLEMTDPGHVDVVARSEHVPMPVSFAFDLADGRIDGLSVRLGGPPPGDASTLALPNASDTEAFTATLERELANRVDENRFSGVVLLARDGKPFFHRGYGLANRESGLDISTGTRFDVGSITKLLTRIAIGQLAQREALDLAASIDRYLPDYPNQKIAREITVQHLLDHTSGLADIFNERWRSAEKKEFIHPEDFFSLFADQPPQFEPGSKRSYSNAGFVVLGAIVETVSGVPYRSYVEEKILKPASMSLPAFPAHDGKRADLAIGYTAGSHGTGHSDSGGPLRPNLGMLPIQGCPAGSSAHTAADLLALDLALRSGRLLDPEWTAWLFGADVVVDDANYPLGVAGGGPGVSAGFESDGRSTAIVLSNLDPPTGSRLAAELFRAIDRAESP